MGKLTKISDILAAPSLPSYNTYDVGHVLNRLADDVDIYEYMHIPDDVDIHPYRIECKGRRSYGDRRGAELYVIYHHDKVICVCSFAGRELSDQKYVYIYDQPLLLELMHRFCKPDVVEKDVFDPDAEVYVAYWEGSPIRLGESLNGYDNF